MNDDTIITLADIAAAGFCRGGALQHANRIGVDFHAVGRGRLTVGALKATNDPLADQVIEACHQRVTGQRAAAVRNEELAVRPSDLKSIGYWDEAIEPLLQATSLTLKDVKQGKLTVGHLRAFGRAETEMLAVAIETRAARSEG